MTKTQDTLARDSEGNSVDLVLYKFDSCPYCQKVMAVVERLGIPLRYRDTDEQPEAWRELLELGGKEQVPCLFVNGRPMFESKDIVDYLQRAIHIGA